MTFGLIVVVQAAPTSTDLVLRRPEGPSKDVPAGASVAVSAVWSILRGPLLRQRAPQDEVPARGCLRMRFAPKGTGVDG
jgi:hypothetical protein